ncbi:MAG: diacylglycerol/lipid kinase family protein [Gemmatimonadales bacterium]
MLVIVNPAAGGGRALARWRQVAPQLRSCLGACVTVVTPHPTIARLTVAEYLARGETAFVAAGGDGTVNLVASSLVQHAPAASLRHVWLGAIGLGSSNDFHKPAHGSARVHGVPYKLDLHRAVRHDVGVLTYEDERGGWRTRFWILNASVGITAEANHAFNERAVTLRWLTRTFPAAGMAYAALRGLLRHRPVEMTLARDGGPPCRVRLRNLGIVKNPHFAGVLRYDSPHAPNGGRFAAHLLEDVSLIGVARVLAGLARGRFMGRPGTRSWVATRLVLQAPRPFTVEVDGETVAALRARFSVLPAALQICA